MNLLSVIFGVLAALGLLVGLLPLLGWTNWFITLPLGLVGLILGALSRVRGGVILCAVVLAFAALRLFLGGGVL